jgi:transcription elongation factor Elf1
MHDKPRVIDDIDEACTTCGKQSVLPFFDGVCMWCSIKCKTCGSSWACEHRNSWSEEYRENHDE